MNPINSARLLACVALVALALASPRVAAAPVGQQESDDFTDEPNNEFDEGPSSSASAEASNADGFGGLQREPSELAGYGGQGDFGAALGPGEGPHYPVAPAASSTPTFGADHALGENNMSTDDDDDAEGADIESSTSNQATAPSLTAADLRAARQLGGGRGGRGDRRQWLGLNGAGADQGNDQGEWSGRDEGFSGDANDEARGEPAEQDSDAQDSNIANAKVELSARDLSTAAGHHHHHGHGVHGWLEMGAKTGKKGAFKWHDKHPVGGKGKK